jgi:ribosome-binding factor A
LVLKEKSIKLQKTESLLKELIPEALGTFDDYRINSITVTDVDCSKGKYDAIVYVYDSSLTKSEKAETIRQLKKVSGAIKSYCLNATSWYKFPSLKFQFDEQVEKTNRLEELFEKIKSK